MSAAIPQYDSSQHEPSLRHRFRHRSSVISAISCHSFSSRFVILPASREVHTYLCIVRLSVFHNESRHGKPTNTHRTLEPERRISRIVPSTCFCRAGIEPVYHRKAELPVHGTCHLLPEHASCLSPYPAFWLPGQDSNLHAWPVTTITGGLTGRCLTKLGQPGNQLFGSGRRV